MKTYLFGLLICFVTISLFFLNSGTSFAQSSLIRAKIGIQISSGEKLKLAKSRDRLKTGDLIRIVIHPEKASYIYVIYSDKNIVSLLSMVEQKIKSSTLVLPSVNDYYQIDGKSSFETFAIIISSKGISEIQSIFQSNPTIEKWSLLEQELKQKSKIKLNEKSDAPFAIAGNVRGGISSDPTKSVLKDLKIFSGNGMIVKKYEFKVKK
ncbi:MAG: DUF4384 domain-containing protein [Desulfobacteraceae bacterium]|nr:DUF4384 domain-containing protein [Desulfobacteraceae bacterium]